MKKLTGRVWLLLCAASFTLHFSLFTSCSESEDDEVGEYAAWQDRNAVYWASLEDSLSRDAANWQKIKSYCKDEVSTGVSTDYIYVRRLVTGSGTTSPLYTDSVRVAYSGRLIPSATYPEGYNFDYTFVGPYSESTANVTDNTCSGWIEGFTTALLHMHTGDVWRIFIPYTLAYGASGSTTIPGYSTLIFDVALVDQHAPGDGPFPTWNARRR